jgi:hypothetical protein
MQTTATIATTLTNEPMKYASGSCSGVGALAAPTKSPRISDDALAD